VLARILQNTRLKSLWLIGNQIGDAGAEALSEALQQNSTLVELDLQFNQIGEAGAAAFVSALAHNNTLTRLDLEDYKINEARTKVLTQLREIKELIERNIIQKELNPSQRTALAQSMEQRIGLLEWDLCLMSELSEGRKPAFGKIYLEKQGPTTLEYVVLSSSSEPIRKILELDIPIEKDLTKELLNSKKPEILKIILERGDISLLADPLMDWKLMHEIAGFADVESPQRKQQRMQQTSEEKQKQEGELSPADRIVTLIAQLSKQLSKQIKFIPESMILPIPLTEGTMNIIKQDITNDIDTILKDAGGYNFQYAYDKDWKLQGTDYNKIHQAIRQFKKEFLQPDGAHSVESVHSTNVPYLLAIARHFEDELIRIHDEYNVLSPRDKILNFIASLDAQLKHHIMDIDAIRQREIILIINNRMDAVLEHQFSEEDQREIEKQISHLKGQYTDNIRGAIGKALQTRWEQDKKARAVRGCLASCFKDGHLQFLCNRIEEAYLSIQGSPVCYYELARSQGILSSCIEREIYQATGALLEKYTPEIKTAFEHFHLTQVSRIELEESLKKELREKLRERIILPDRSVQGALGFSDQEESLYSQKNADAQAVRLESLHAGYMPARVITPMMTRAVEAAPPLEGGEKPATIHLPTTGKKPTR